MDFLNSTVADTKKLGETDDPLTAFLKSWENTAGNFVKGYVLSIGVLLTCINNIIVIIILKFGSEVKLQMTQPMRIYYGALAFGDTNAAILHFTYWAGRRIFLFNR